MNRADGAECGQPQSYSKIGSPKAWPPTLTLPYKGGGDPTTFERMLLVPSPLVGEG